jgi:uncharacterized protein (DUF1778 family)
MVAKRKPASSTRLKTSTIQLRAKEAERDLIDRAAEVVGKNRSEFIIESSLSEAQKVLLDQTSFQLSVAEWKALNAILDAPAKKNPKLEKLMKQSAPWESTY